MPVSHRIDTASRIVLSRAWDEVTDEELTKNRAALFRDPHFEPTLRQLFDFSEVTKLSVTPECVRALATTSQFSPTAQRAIVVSSDVAYGMARMYGLMSGRGPDVYGVFRTAARAMTWLEERNG